ncbi:arginine ABC transporter permease ArtM, partial [Aeromonas sanarellii]
MTALSLLLGVAMAALMTWVLERRIPVATKLLQLCVLVFTGSPL